MLDRYLVAGVVGVMLFFTVVVAPTIFKVLPQQWASAYVRRFFPRYYLTLGLVCAGAAVLAGDGPLAWAGWGSAIAFALSLAVLTPAINAASDAGARRRFGVLHGLSVVLNLAQLGALAWALWRV